MGWSVLKGRLENGSYVRLGEWIGMKSYVSLSRNLRFGMAVALLLPLMACSTIEGMNPFATAKYKTKIDPVVPADTMYDQGLVRLQKHDDGDAAKQFSKIALDHPFSSYAEKSQLMEAYADYRAGKYDDAIGAAHTYYVRYATSPDVPYALYLAGMSYYDQIPDISRDQTMTTKAQGVFQQIVTKYPNSPYAEEAKFKLLVTQDQLAGKQMSIGRYYLMRRDYPAAISRFRTVLGQYQRTRHTPEALERLTEAYLALGLPDEAETAAAVLGHNFPDSPWYKDAYSLLKGRGLAPHENAGSWISTLAHSVGLG